MTEPQIGIEPMTAWQGELAPDAASLCRTNSADGETSQAIPETRPKLVESGNEVATVNIARTADGKRRHEVVVDTLVAHGWRRRGLRDYLRWRAGDAIREDWDPEQGGGDDEWACIADALQRIGRIPDAWRVVTEGEAEGWAHPVEVLELAEVEVTHALTLEKRSEYAWLWARGDACDALAVRVWGYDMHGYQYPALVTGEDYYETLLRDAARREAA